MSLVDYRTAGPVAVITLNNARANCYTLEPNKELDGAILRARFDDSVHVIVLTGAGDRFFCAGADIAMLEAVTPRYKYYFCLHAKTMAPPHEAGLAVGLILRACQTGAEVGLKASRSSASCSGGSSRARMPARGSRPSTTSASRSSEASSRSPEPAKEGRRTR